MCVAVAAASVTHCGAREAIFIMALGEKTHWQRVTKNTMETRRNMFPLPSRVVFSAAVVHSSFFSFSAAHFLSWPSDEVVTFSRVLPRLHLVAAGRGCGKTCNPEFRETRHWKWIDGLPSLGMAGSKDAELLSAQTEMSRNKSENKGAGFWGLKPHMFVADVAAFKTEQKVENWSRRSF